MKELIAIQTELKAPKSQTNTFGKYKYRSLEDILEALKPLLQKQNCFVSLTDEITLIGDRYYVKATATIRNDSGDSVSVSAMAREEENKKGMDSAQLTGATSSYARKYALNGLFAIDDTKDADATNTHGNEPQQKAPPQSKTTDEQVRINKEQFEELQKLIDESGADIEKFCQTFKIGSLSEMYEAHYEKAITALNKKLAEKVLG